MCLTCYDNHNKLKEKVNQLSFVFSNIIYTGSLLEHGTKLIQDILWHIGVCRTKRFSQFQSAIHVYNAMETCNVVR